jgi:hypothetical protein
MVALAGSPTNVAISAMMGPVIISPPRPSKEGAGTLAGVSTVGNADTALREIEREIGNHA